MKKIGFAKSKETNRYLKSQGFSLFKQLDDKLVKGGQSYDNKDKKIVANGSSPTSGKVEMINGNKLEFNYNDDF